MVSESYIELLNWADSEGYGNGMRNHQCVKDEGPLDQAYVFSAQQDLRKIHRDSLEIDVKVSGSWRRDYREGDVAARASKMRGLHSNDGGSRTFCVRKPAIPCVGHRGVR